MRRFFKFPAMVAVVAAATAAIGADHRPVLMFFGDSLTEGLGVEREQAYPALIQQKLKEAGLPHEVVNAGVSGETTAGGLRRVSWVLQRHVEVFVLALGGNDGLRGVPVEETERNLNGIIARVREIQPEARIILFGIETLPNMGEPFREAFREVFPRVAAANSIPFLPFFIDGVGGIAEMNQVDGIHPNERGHEIIAESVWRFIHPLLDESREPEPSSRQAQLHADNEV